MRIKQSVVLQDEEEQIYVKGSGPFVKPMAKGTEERLYAKGSGFFVKPADKGKVTRKRGYMQRNSLEQ